MLTIMLKKDATPQNQVAFFRLHFKLAFVQEHRAHRPFSKDKLVYYTSFLIFHRRTSKKEEKSQQTFLACQFFSST